MNLDSRMISEIAALADVSIPSVRKRLLGGKVRGRAGIRLEAALALKGWARAV